MKAKKFKCCKSLYNLTGIMKTQLKHFGGFWDALGLLFQQTALTLCWGRILSMCNSNCNSVSYVAG